MKFLRLCFVLSFSGAVILGVKALTDTVKHKILLFPMLILLVVSLIFLILSSVVKSAKPIEAIKSEAAKPAYKSTEAAKSSTKEKETGTKIGAKPVRKTGDKPSPAVPPNGTAPRQKNESVLTVHISGLDIPQNSPCQFSLNKEKIIISGSGKDLVIPISEISRVESETTMEIYNHYISGISGSARSSKYGVAGNMIGERRKESSTALETEYYLILERSLPERRSEYLVFNCGTSAKVINNLKNYIMNFSK